MPFAEFIGERLPEKQSDFGMLMTTSILGVVVTFAEPSISSLQSIAGYVSHPTPLLACMVQGNPFLLLTSIASGVGVAAGLGMMRIRHSWSLLSILKIWVPIILLVTALAPGDLQSIVGLMWDAGAITTGPATVPIVLALGAGVAEDVGGNENESDLKGFGVVTLASLCPVISVLICGVLMIYTGAVDDFQDKVHAAMQQPQNATEATETLQQIAITQAGMAVNSIFPLIAYLLLVQAVIIREALPDLRGFVEGVTYCTVGLSIFNFGLNYGSLPLGDSAGQGLPAVMDNVQGTMGYAIILFFGFAGGLMSTFIDLEPCGLGERVEKLTCGLIKKLELFLAVAIGAGFGVALGLSRLIFDFDILYILLAGYAVALGLSCFCDEGIVCIAWDAAGVTTGPVTVPLVLSVGVGLAGAVGTGGGFGMLASTAVFPIIGVLSLGVTKLGVRRKSVVCVPK